jgi:glyoxylase-like metal-dependent hydrolase (beta-lactamase superfamily II)
MLVVRCFVHEESTSNTYLLSNGTFKEDVFLIDIGNSQDVLKTLTNKQKIKGIFLTHAHFDHIYGINDIITQYPDCIVYCSDYAFEGLFSEKLNLSFYHQKPIILESNNTSIISDDMVFELFPNCQLKVLETKGHNKGSLCFKVNSVIFTGDSLIPKVPVVTKLKSGNKEEAIKSILKIKKNSQPNDMVYPGHGAPCKISDIDWDLYINNDRN